MLAVLVMLLMIGLQVIMVLSIGILSLISFMDI